MDSAGPGTGTTVTVRFPAIEAQAAENPGTAAPRHERRRKIVIIDIGMPQLDGYEVAKKPRARNQRIFLIALTGYGQLHDKDRALEVGFDAHVTKPADVDKLAELMTAAA